MYKGRRLCLSALGGGIKWLTEQTEGTSQPPAKDRGSIQQASAAEKYVEITSCKSAK